MNRRAFVRSLGPVLGVFGLSLTMIAPSPAAGAADPLAAPLWRSGDQVAAATVDSFVSPGRYKMVSFAATPNPATVSGVFGDELGGYDPARWRFGFWRPDLGTDGQYIEPGTFTDLVHGRGYWLLTKDSLNVRFAAETTPVAGTDTFVVQLGQGPAGPGWNMVGNPFPFPISANNFRVAKRDVPYPSLPAANTAGVVDANPRVWDPVSQTYNSVATINRGEAFWLQVKDTTRTPNWTRWVVGQGTLLYGVWPSVKFDSKGNPHIAYYDDSQGALLYARRSGDRWLIEVVDTQGASYTGAWASLQLDSLDLPYIAYQSLSTLEPFFVRKQSPTTWTVPERIEPGPNNGNGIRLALFHGQPQVVYFDGANNKLKYVVKTVGGWSVIDTVDRRAYVQENWPSNFNTYLSGGLGFALDSRGVPHIVTQTQPRTGPFGVRYTTRNGAIWVSQTIDTLPGGSTGWTPFLTVDANNNPHISYYAQSAGTNALKYATRTGTGPFSIQQIEAVGNTGLYSSISLDPQGNPVIAYMEGASTGVPTRIKLATKSGTNWIVEVVDDQNIPTSFLYTGSATGPDGRPRVAYFGSGAGGTQLRFAEKTLANVRLKLLPVAVAPRPEPALTTKPDGALWAVAVTARQGGRGAEPVWVGAAPPKSIDELRSMRAPAPMGTEALSLHLQREDGDYVREFATDAVTLRWDLTTAGGETPGEQTLSFSTFDLPADVKLYLTDPDGGWTREVSDGSVIQVAARGPRTLELVASRNGPPAPANAGAEGLRFVYPSPFSRTTGLTFALARSGDIAVDLYDVTGRRVTKLERVGAAPGENVLVWDGRDDAGRTVKSGVYFARWTAGPASGTHRVVKVE